MERKSYKFLILITLFLSLFISLYASYSEAYNLYLSGLKAYRAGEYENAQKFLNYALEMSPKIEDDVPEIKLYLGLSAFQNKNYEIAYQYLSLFPNNALAKESIRVIENDTLTKDIDLGDLVIKNPTNTTTTIENNNFNFGNFLTITIIIFIISILSAVAVWFFLKRFSTINFSKTENTSNSETEENTDETEETVEAINLEEVINLKLDNLETIWQKSKALKKLLGEIDEELVYDDQDENSEETNKTDKLKKMIDDSMKDVNLDELENILENVYEKESSEEFEDENKDEKTENNEKFSTDETKKEDEENIPVEASLNEVKESWEESSNSIKPDEGLKNIYNKIMNEKESEILREAENFNDLDSLIKNIEVTNKDKGRKNYTQAQIESIFKTNFFEINNEKIK